MRTVQHTLRTARASAVASTWVSEPDLQRAGGPSLDAPMTVIYQAMQRLILENVGELGRSMVPDGRR